jgi:hypothetical protein
MEGAHDDDDVGVASTTFFFLESIWVRLGYRTLCSTYAVYVQISSAFSLTLSFL